MIRNSTVLVLILVVLAILVAACGGSRADGDGVATIDDPGGGAAASPSPSMDPQEAMLAFAECMREHGFDMPDPQVGSDGGIVRVAPIGGVAGGTDVDIEAFRAANEACRPLIAGIVQDRDREPISPEDQEQFLAFTRCMRENGIDLPDPQFGDDGGVVIGRPGTMGVPSFDSETFQAAQEACRDLLPGSITGPIGGADVMETRP